MTLRERLKGLGRTQQMMWLFFIWLLLFCFLWIWWDERTLPDIRGAWASAGCETVRSADGVSYLKRFLRVGDERRSLTIDFYVDAACEKPLLSQEIEGPYDLGPDSMEVRGATTARFDSEKMTLTPRAPETAEAFDKGRCAAGDWKVGEAQEVTELGCLGIVPTRSSCPVEYDIVKFEDGALYLGDRSQGLCVTERYPKRFSPLPLYPFKLRT